MQNQNIYAVLSERIPEEQRQQVVEAVNRTYRSITPNWVDMTFLFEVWNANIAPTREPENMNCRGCRSKVIGKYREIVKTWENAG